MNPSQNQLLPVLSIDLGASYTKLAWRPKWAFLPHRSDPQNRFTQTSEPIKIDDEFLVPSIVLDPGDRRDWQFGKDAARSTPGPNAHVFRNWKATLFDAKASDGDVKRAVVAASKFFGWLRKQLGGRYQVGEAWVRVCVPEFGSDDIGIGTRRLQGAFEEAGWGRHQWMQVAEPRANVLGLASGGRNCVNVYPNYPPSAFLPGIYDETSPLMLVAKNVANGGLPVTLVTIDIGAFTTDTAVCLVTSDVEVTRQESFKHGISLLDDTLRKLIRAGGVDVDALSHAEFELNKRAVYNGAASRWAVGSRSITLESRCMEGIITKFADDLLGMCQIQARGAYWFVVTGGGSEIPVILNRIQSKLKAISDMRCVQDSFSDCNQRIATALGGASVVLDFSDSAPRTKPESLNIDSSSGSPCKCGGANKECVMCQGIGWMSDTTSEAKPRSSGPTVSKGPISGGHSLAGKIPESDASEPKRGAVLRPHDQPHSSTHSTSGANTQSRKDRSEKPEEDIDASSILACWRGREGDAKQEFGLEGWMGGLVFGAVGLSSAFQRGVLQDPFSASGKAAWLRLLCLGSCLGVRARTPYIRTFWENKLPDVWRALIPADLNQVVDEGYNQHLNEIFLNAIHREFNDMDATGEDAELWRRVFYDFRKLHHFVYRNDLPLSLLQLSVQPGLQTDSLIAFLKSGFVPGGQKRWAGAIGQSMTAPLLFLLRELRRLEVIDTRFDQACLYMNSPARRVARQLGWISMQDSTMFDIESLVDISRTCHCRMENELVDLLPFFDLPFQWYAHQNPC